MAKYDGWTLGETEAILNIMGGVGVARSVLRGERKLVVEDAQPSAPATPAPIVGTMVKTLHLMPYAAASVADAIALGRYNGVTEDIVRLFVDDEVGLTAEVGVDLFQFDRSSSNEDLSAWAKANARQPILPKHVLAIGAQHPDEQRNAPIVALGSVRGGCVLYLYGGSGWRRLYRDTVKSGWHRDYLFGFLSE